MSSNNNNIHGHSSAIMTVPVPPPVLAPSLCHRKRERIPQLPGTFVRHNSAGTGASSASKRWKKTPRKQKPKRVANAWERANIQVQEVKAKLEESI
jgi:hypothetical protein